MLNNFLRPLIVCGVPRSGTSLLTGLAVMHGAWVGDCRPADSRNPCGYFENEKIKKLLDKKTDYSEAWGEALKQGYDGGIWVYKCPVRQILKLKIMNFHPTVILARRDTDSVLASQKEYPGHKDDLSDSELKTLLNKKLGLLLEAEKEYTSAAYEVWFEDLMEGNYRQLEKAISAAGLNFDSKLTYSYIRRDLDHYGGTDD